MTFNTKLAGVAYSNDDGVHRQIVIMQLKKIGLLEQGQQLYFVQEKMNNFDSNAIAVLGPDQRQLGYLPKDMALNVCEAISNGLSVKIFISEVTGGSPGKLFGVNVNILIEQPKNFINNFSNISTPNVYDDDMLIYCLEQEKHDWNPHDLDVVDYENWLDSLNK